MQICGCIKTVLCTSNLVHKYILHSSLPAFDLRVWLRLDSEACQNKPQMGPHLRRNANPALLATVCGTHQL